MSEFAVSASVLAIVSVALLVISCQALLWARASYIEINLRVGTIDREKMEYERHDVRPMRARPKAAP